MKTVQWFINFAVVPFLLGYCLADLWALVL